MTTRKVPTVDGKRTDIKHLNLGATAGEQGSAGRFRRAWRNFSLFLAGMYTGVKCGGVPHSHHSYDRDQDRDDAPL